MLQDLLIYRFEKTYEEWKAKRLTQEEAASLLGVCDRTFRRYIVNYEEEGMQGLVDMRMSQISHKRAPVDEVTRLVDLYRNHYLLESPKFSTVDEFYLTRKIS